MKLGLLAIACWLVTTLALTAAEPVALTDVLAGKTAALQLKLKDLNSDWYHVSLNGNSPAAGAAGVSRAYMAMLMGDGAGGSGSHYTKGATVKLEGETFLIACRLAVKPIDFQAMMRGGGQPPAPEKPTPDSVLNLCLIRVAGLDGISEIRPFDLVIELAGGDTSPEALAAAKEQAAEASGLGNLLAIGAALAAYAQDGDKTLPPMKDVTATIKALEPYCKARNAFVSPDSKATYAPNPSLAGRKLADIAKPGEVVAFYDPQPVNNQRGVVYLDGRAERVSETKWPALKKASQIP